MTTNKLISTLLQLNTTFEKLNVLSFYTFCSWLRLREWEAERLPRREKCLPWDERCDEWRLCELCSDWAYRLLSGASPNADGRVRRWISRCRKRSILPQYFASSGLTSVIASPLFSARAVRPIRCT